MDNLDVELGNLSVNHGHDSMFDFLQYAQTYTMLSNFKIVQINMRSIRNLEKFDSLKEKIDEIHNLDIIIVSETWLNKDYFQFYNINGYKSFFSGRDIGEVGGGLCCVLL